MGEEFFDTAERALNQEDGGDSCWANFGYWQGAQSYPQAGRGLAALLADASGLQADHKVLDLGFGMGEQLRLWQQTYGVDTLLGINPSASQCNVARSLLPDSSAYELHVAGVEGLPQLLPGHRFQRMLALDCAYHFPQREALFRLLREHIDVSGRLAWTDLYLPPQQSSTQQAIARRALCAASRIPLSNLQRLPDWQDCLSRSGWQLELHTDISAQVLQPFAHWWRGYRRRYHVPRRARMKFDMVAAVVDRAARYKLFQYGLFVARPVEPSRQ